jgi:hypothetical protein
MNLMYCYYLPDCVTRLDEPVTSTGHKHSTAGLAMIMIREHRGVTKSF